MRKFKNQRGQSMPPVMYSGGDQHEGKLSPRVYTEKPATSDETPQVYMEGRLIVVCDSATRLVCVAVVKSFGHVERMGLRGGLPFLATDPKMLVSLVGDP